MNKAFLTYCKEDAVLLRKNAYPIVGFDALQKFFSQVDSSFTLRWRPVYVKISASADLGYTYGFYEFFLKAQADVIESGTYVSIWEKDTNNNWKYVLDSGNEGLGK